MNPTTSHAEPRSALVVGGRRGLIGAAVARRLTDDGWSVVRTARPGNCPDGDLALDLGAPEDTWPSLPAIRCCLIAAGVTSMAACRADPQASARVNVTGTAALARRLSAVGAHVVFLSTNHVFDGSRPKRRPDAPPSPLNAYGRQKAAAEKALGDLGPAATVIRLTKVLSPDAPLLQGWRDSVAAANTIAAFGDMVLAPLSLEWTADLIVRAMEEASGGVLHASGDEDLSYAEVARGLIRTLGADPALVDEVSYADRGIPDDEAPSHTTLHMEDTCRRLGVAAPGSRAVVDECLKSLVA